MGPLARILYIEEKELSLYRIHESGPTKFLIKILEKEFVSIKYSETGLKQGELKLNFRGSARANPIYRREGALPI